MVSVGCSPFAPELTKGEGSENFILTDQTSTGGVFKNFSYAYNFKDSLVYSDLLDSSFIFISKNYTTTPITNLTWGKYVDIRTTVGLFRHFQTLDLVWDGTISDIELDDNGSMREQKKTFRLTFDGGNDFPSIDGEALFVLKRKERSIKDTTKIWVITRWEDLSSF
jgi:hypothetical protein